jgi:hypothetical protein
LMVVTEAHWSVGIDPRTASPSFSGTTWPLRLLS